MDRFAGTFGTHDDAEPFGYDPSSDDAHDPDDGPLSPVGQDERRMQVRAYNHWASLLGSSDFPDVADLEPESIEDFGPFGVLLYFDEGLEDPRIVFIGEALARECEAEGHMERLSDVPSRSLLSRITDHYMQILANQAPIGFEAEFQNARGVEVLYRGILLPWSSDGETIDHIFGVINWKEMADAATAEALLSEIDAALEAPVPVYEGKDMDRMLDLAKFTALDDETSGRSVLPSPTFGAATPAPDGGSHAEPLELTAEFADEYELDAAEADEDEAYDTSEWGAGFSGFGEEEKVYSVDYGAQGLEDGEEDESDYDGVVDPLGDESAGLGLATLVSRGQRTKPTVALPDGPAAARDPAFDYETLEQRLRAAIPQGYGADEPSPGWERAPVQPVPAESGSREDDDDFDGIEAASRIDDDDVRESDDGIVLELETGPAENSAEEDDASDQDGPISAPGTAETEGLYDCLAAARELAQTARSSEDRGRKALYQAVGLAYDFSLEAAANPEDFSELLAENGLTVQVRAPMTPVVKLVFGADYDKTRLTEYATVLGFAHRTGVERGDLATVLQRAEGGLKGVVQAERRARREAAGEAPEKVVGLRSTLAKKLREREAITLKDLAIDGPEFSLVMVRRTADGRMELVGEVPDDVKLVEKAARRLLA